jgi:hypothetical protein
MAGPCHAASGTGWAYSVNTQLAYDLLTGDFPKNDAEQRQFLIFLFNNFRIAAKKYKTFYMSKLFGKI